MARSCAKTRSPTRGPSSRKSGQRGPTSRGRTMTNEPAGATVTCACSRRHGCPHMRGIKKLGVTGNQHARLNSKASFAIVDGHGLRTSFGRQTDSSFPASTGSISQGRRKERQRRRKKLSRANAPDAKRTVAQRVEKSCTRSVFPGGSSNPRVVQTRNCQHPTGRQVYDRLVKP